MFYYISGTLVHAAEKSTGTGFAVIDAGGIGYRLSVSQTTRAALPAQGSQVKLLTYMNVREDNVELFGFATGEEQSAFVMLLSVSGVGPKAAISVLSLLSPEKFALAVCGEDVKALSRAPGVGAKTAARIVLELKDKLLKDSPLAGGAKSSPGGGSPQAGHGALGDAQDALIVLGYTRSEVLAALRSVDPAQDTEGIIRAALKVLMR